MHKERDAASTDIQAAAIAAEHRRIDLDLAMSATGQTSGQWRYWIGYYCPRGTGHFELCENEDYDGCCGSKGWDLYLDADPEDSNLPEGEWRLVPASE